MHAAGRGVVLVHGGGAAISKALADSGLPVQFHNGLRVTDPATLSVLVSVAAGSINTELVAQLSGLGARAVGLTGADGPTLLCRRDDPALGLVGAVETADTSLLNTLLTAGFVPVVAPVGILCDGGHATAQLLNLNADTVAGHLAAALSAHTLVLLTDTEGVKDGAGNVVPALDAARINELRAAGAISGGMLPKVAAAMVAVRAGVPAVVADGRVAGTLPAAVAGDSGTRITP
jgi:acetylglutamate kinase